MAVSGTTGFNPDFTEIAEEAWERAGREMRTGYDLRTARRSMNLLTIEWANRGINLWTIDEGYLQLAADDATYNLPTDTVDVCELFLRENDGVVATQADRNINRISVSTYAAIPNKLTTGKPLQAFVHRLGTDGTYKGGLDSTVSTNVAPFITLWPVRRIQDASSSDPTKNNPDISYRFLPCLVAGLAFYLSLKIPNAGDRTQFLKQEYEEQWVLASTEDREKATLRLAPRRQHI